MAIPLARFLVEFGRDEPAAAAPDLEPVAPPPAPAAEALAARTEEAFARGEEAGRTAAEAEFRDRLAALQAEYEQSLKDRRAAWTAEQAEVLADKVALGLKQLEAGIADPLAAVLRPFLANALRSQVLEGLCGAIATLLAEGRHAAMRISGPEDLLDAVRARLGAFPASVEFQTSDAVDVSVRTGTTHIESQMRACLDLFGPAA